MDETIIKNLSKTLNIAEKAIVATLKLLEEGNTIPFIARYRKELTGSLNEEEIRNIAEVYDYQVNLTKRKNDVIRLIDEKGLLTPELKEQILNANKLVDVEDLYRPYKEKKKTKATIAINLGLEPLAKIMMSFPIKGDLDVIARSYLNDDVKTVAEAISYAQDIIAEWIGDNAYFRKWIRNYIYSNGNIVSKIKKDANDEKKVYEMYYDFKEPIKLVKPHRILALNRGEDTGVLSVKIDIAKDKIIAFLESKLIKNESSFVVPFIKEAILDAYKRLIFPAIEREIRAELFLKAEDKAIFSFSENLEKLLLQPPLKDKMVLGFDPAYRTGCKLAVLDRTGKNLEVAVIYPNEPRNEIAKSKEILLNLIDKYNIDIVAIGNGTASRESEMFVADALKEANHKVSYVIANEAGASVYSASKLAISEFPDLTVEKRSAISIGRRIQDPLAELVKIDPESIGVGLYQHDVSQKKLKDSLDFIVSKVVNAVGVNVNTASPALLKYVSGITKPNIDKILAYRNTIGKIKTRKELLTKKILTSKTYEQAIGFLRINGEYPLDATAIHPESYDTTLNLLAKLDLKLEDIGSEQAKTKLNDINIDALATSLNIDTYTLKDIIASLIKPNLDPRDEMPMPLLKSDVLTLDDLKVGMKLQGTVRNIVPFGAFIDIGMHSDGLVHISALANHYIKDPSEVVSVGDIVDCYVKEVYKDKEKVALSLIPLDEK